MSQQTGPGGGDGDGGDDGDGVGGDDGDGGDGDGDGGDGGGNVGDDDGDVGDDGMIYEWFLEPDGQHGLLVHSGDPQVALWILLQ